MNKTVLITGSSSGIGKETAKCFKKNNWNVIATMRSPEKERELSQFENILCIPLDVTNPETIKGALAQALARFKSIDVVVNNAGYGAIGPFEASSPEIIERQFTTNLFGVMEIIRAILPHFRERGDGTFINVASMGGRTAFPFFSLYHGTKWALEGFSESLQYELRPLNIKIKIIEPGPTKTEFFGRSLDIMRNSTCNIYNHNMNQAMKNMQASTASGVTPGVVAKTIYKAATDGSWKLRYPVGTKGTLILRKILSDQVFHKIVRMMLLR